MKSNKDILHAIRTIQVKSNRYICGLKKIAIYTHGQREMKKNSFYEMWGTMDQIM